MWRDTLKENIHLDTTGLDQAGLEYVESVLRDMDLKCSVSTRVKDADIPGSIVIACVENSLIYNYSRQGAVVVGLYLDSALTSDQLERPITEWVNIFGPKAMWQAALFRSAKQLESKDTQSPTGESVGILLQEIAAASPIILTIYDLRAQKNIYQSKSIFHELGYTTEDIEQILAKSDMFPKSIFHQDYLDAIGHYYEDIGALPDGHKKQLIYQIRDIHGNWQWVRKITSVFRRDENGVPTQVLNSFENITAQKYSEGRIFETEARNKALLEAIPDIVLRLDENGNCIDFSGNPRAEKYIALHKGQEISIKEYFSLPLQDMFSIEVAQEVKRKVQDTISSGEVRLFETIIELLDGLHFYEVLLNRSGEHEVIAIARDVTSRKKDEELLKQRLEYIEFVNRFSRQLSFAKIDSIDEPINTVLEELCVFSGFQRSYIFLEKEPDFFELSYEFNLDKQRTLPDNMKFLSAKGFEVFLDKCKLGEPFSFTISEGHEAYWPESMAQILYSQKTKFVLVVPLLLANRFLGVLGVSTHEDSPENKDLLMQYFKIAGQLLSTSLIRQYTIKELIDSRERALEASKAKEDFLATISHEIRTPLNAIVGMNELLASSGLNEQQIELVSAIRVSSKNLLNIVNDILDFSMIESGKMNIEIDKVDIEGIYTELVGIFEVKAKEKGLAFSVEIQNTDSNEFYSDQTRVDQILFNLVSNAIKFTERGRVEVNMKKMIDSDQNIWLELMVTDTGIGIPDALKEIIFDRFYQVDSSSTRKFQGTGLGLAIVKRLVELLGGEIELWSEEGNGSMFKVLLPSKPNDYRKGNIGASKHGKSKLKGVILLVEDNLLNRMVAERYLQNAGLTVLLAENGKEALDILMAEKVDMIFMDLQMPIMDGMEATKLIKKLHGEKS